MWVAPKIILSSPGTKVTFPFPFSIPIPIFSPSPEMSSLRVGVRSQVYGGSPCQLPQLPCFQSVLDTLRV